MATPEDIPQDLGPDCGTPDKRDDESSVHLPKSIQRQHALYNVPQAYTISSLPKDILLRIFSFLDVESLLMSSKVSRLWKSLTSKPCVWEDVVISGNTSFDLLDAMTAHCGSSMRKLHVEWDTWNVLALHKLITGGSNIEVIDIRRTRVKDLTLRVIALNCKKLRCLNMDNANLVTLEGIEALCRNCNSLESLYLKGARIGDEEIETIARACPHLLSFRVGYRDLDVSPKSLRLLASSCPELRKVIIDDCNTFTDEHVTELASNCSGLTHLTISANYMITNASLLALSKYCPAIEDLNFRHSFDLSDDGFAALAPNCPRLKHLDLRGNSLITDTTVFVIVERCSSLTMLGLSNCKLVTDASLIFLASCKKLTHLYLDGNSKITDGGVSHLCSIKELRVLSLLGCCRLSEESVYHLADHCSKLKVLKIRSSVCDTLAGNRRLEKLTQKLQICES